MSPRESLLPQCSPRGVRGSLLRHPLRSRYPDDTALILVLYVSGGTVAWETDKIAALCTWTSAITLRNPLAFAIPELGCLRSVRVQPWAASQLRCGARAPPRSSSPRSPPCDPNPLLSTLASPPASLASRLTRLSLAVNCVAQRENGANEEHRLAPTRFSRPVLDIDDKGAIYIKDVGGAPLAGEGERADEDQRGREKERRGAQVPQSRAEVLQRDLPRRVGEVEQSAGRCGRYICSSAKDAPKPALSLVEEYWKVWDKKNPGGVSQDCLRLGDSMLPHLGYCWLRIGDFARRVSHPSLGLRKSILLK